jgi:hypothetical protein
VEGYSGVTMHYFTFAKPYSEAAKPYFGFVEHIPEFGRHITVLHRLAKPYSGFAVANFLFRKLTPEITSNDFINKYSKYNFSLLTKNSKT